MNLFHVAKGHTTCFRPHLFSCDTVNDAIAHTHKKGIFFDSRRCCCRRRRCRLEPVLNWCQFAHLDYKLCVHFQWAFRMWVQISFALITYITAYHHIFYHRCFDVWYRKCNDGNEDRRCYPLLRYFSFLFILLSVYVCNWVNFAMLKEEIRIKIELYGLINWSMVFSTINHICCAMRHNRFLIRITFVHPMRWKGKVIFLLDDRPCNSQWANWTCFLHLDSFVSSSHFF